MGLGSESGPRQAKLLTEMLGGFALSSAAFAGEGWLALFPPGQLAWPLMASTGGPVFSRARKGGGALSQVAPSLWPCYVCMCFCGVAWPLL